MQKDDHLRRPSRNKLNRRTYVRRRNAIWYHYRRAPPPTLFRAFSQECATRYPRGSTNARHTNALASRSPACLTRERTSVPCSRAHRPIFWAILQKNALIFAMVPEFWAVCLAPSPRKGPKTAQNPTPSCTIRATTAFQTAQNFAPAKTESAGILRRQPQSRPRLPYNVRVA